MDLPDYESEEYRQSLMSEMIQATKDSLFRLKEIFPTAKLKEIFDALLEKVRQLPFINNINLNVEGDSKYKIVQTSQIIGTVSSAFKILEDEYRERKARHYELFRDLVHAFLDNNLEDFLNDIFYITIKDKTNSIRLIEMQGITGFGSIYIIKDGTHRVSFSKLIGLDKLPAFVETAKLPTELATTSQIVVNWWKMLAEGGLIKISDITSGFVFKTREYKCKILESPQIPWVVLTRNASEFAMLNRAYDELHPGSLDNLPLRKDILLDEQNLVKAI